VLVPYQKKQPPAKKKKAAVTAPAPASSSSSAALLAAQSAAAAPTTLSAALSQVAHGHHSSTATIAGPSSSSLQPSSLQPASGVIAIPTAVGAGASSTAAASTPTPTPGDPSYVDLDWVEDTEAVIAGKFHARSSLAQLRALHALHNILRACLISHAVCLQERLTDIAGYLPFANLLHTLLRSSFAPSVAPDIGHLFSWSALLLLGTTAAHLSSSTHIFHNPLCKSL
jgi:hypothetical protein